MSSRLVGNCAASRSNRGRHRLEAGVLGQFGQPGGIDVLLTALIPPASNLVGRPGEHFLEVVDEHHVEQAEGDLALFGVVLGTAADVPAVHFEEVDGDPLRAAQRLEQVAARCP